MLYDATAAVLVDAFRQGLDSIDAFWVHRAIYALHNSSATTAISPRVLWREDVWPTTRRYQFIGEMGGKGTISSPAQGRPFGLFIAEVEALAAEEQAPVVTEWHLVATLAKIGDNALTSFGINTGVLLQRLGELSGRIEPSDDDKKKMWCFCDTHLFLHYKSFTDPDWHKQLQLGNVVLVIPAAIIRELDDLKFQKSGQIRTQARRRLSEIKKVAFQGAAGSPACVGEGVELLLLAHEPRAFPEGLDPSLADDRLIASAYEFRWQRQGLKVALLSGDTTIQLKAREYGLEFVEIPPCLELDLEPSGDKSASKQQGLPTDRLLAGRKQSAQQTGLSEEDPSDLT